MNNFQRMLGPEEEPRVNSKLQAVFGKIAKALPRPADLAGGSSATKTMSSDIIESVLAGTPIPPVPHRYDYDPSYPTSEGADSAGTVAQLSRLLEAELRAAKHTLLACGEVLLPCDLLPRISQDVLAMAESEPCGLRGCTLFLSFETDTVCRRLGTVKCDPATVSTFELYLTLKQEHSWHSILPQFIKNLTKGGTVMISPSYTLYKNKLYRSYQHSE